MQIKPIERDNIRYNPALCAFEATVEIAEAGEVYHYPGHVVAPLNAELRQIKRKLAKVARNAHRTRRPGLRARFCENQQDASVVRRAA